MSDSENQAEHAEIAARLRALRQAHSEMNIKKWASFHDFQYSQYRNWENGTRRIPLEAAEYFCEKYGLSLDWLYLGRWTGLSEDAASRLQAQSQRA